MKRRVKVYIESKNINRLIFWMIQNKIEYYYLNKINNNAALIILDNKDIKLIKKYSPTIKIKYISLYGILKISDYLKKNYIVYVFLVIFVMSLFFLSNIIFSINVYSNNLELKRYVENELNNYGIRKYTFKRTKKELSQLSDKFINDHRDKFEWLEISSIGTKYVVKFVERHVNVKGNSNLYQSIVSKKNAIITNIYAEAGEIVKTIDEYVKKDDLIISGELVKPDGEIIKKSAIGKVYGEVWYKVSVKLPLYKSSKKYIGKDKYNILFEMGMNNKNLINYKFKNYDNYKIYSFDNNIIPFSISIVKQREYLNNYKENFIEYTNAYVKEYIEEYLKQNNDSFIEVKKYIELDSKYDSKYVNYVYFVSVLEDITKIIDISN